MINYKKKIKKNNKIIKNYNKKLNKIIRKKIIFKNNLKKK